MTDKTKIFRRIGFYKDQSGIMKRYIREKNNWKSHIENTKAFILNAAQNKNKNRVAVLGSGWLLDVPLHELSELFNEVWLFDIHHPDEVKSTFNKYPNIKPVSTDLSGFAVPIYNEGRLRNIFKSFSADHLNPVFDFDLSVFDFVVSCNILNQLDIILIDYLKKFRTIKQPVENAIRKKIQDAHIDILPKGKSCLVSDMEELSVNENDKIIERKNLIHTEKIPDLKDQWTWKFDNNYTYNAGNKTWFKVGAINI